MVINHKISYLGSVIPNEHNIQFSRSINYLDYPAVKDNNAIDNICSDKYDPDRELTALHIMEAWNKFGVKLTYYDVSYDVNKDRIWGEDTDRHVLQEWSVMGKFEHPKENKVWSKFGIEGINDFSIMVSKEHFRYATNDYIPQIGDLILVNYNKILYEVVEVKEETPSFLLAKKYAWELIVKRAKIENSISVSPTLSASPISSFYEIDDMFDIKNTVDVEKDDVLYEPESGEQPNKDPFGNW